jgi:catechol 2,3-dioxygenase-like lactoylglutathione lyase family enzyme
VTTPFKLRFSHVGFHVTDVERMSRFYKEVLGFTQTDRGELDTPTGALTLVFLSRDPDEHHQIVLLSGRPEKLSFNVINQISLRAERLEALQDMFVRLRELAVSELVGITHGNAFSVYFKDPEGNRIELYVDSPRHGRCRAFARAPSGAPKWCSAWARTEPWKQEARHRPAGTTGCHRSHRLPGQRRSARRRKPSSTGRAVRCWRPSFPCCAAPS